MCRDYWLLDAALADPDALRARCLAKTDWIEGYPFKPESWPGLRAIQALDASQLARIETWVREVTGAEKLWQEVAPDGGRLNHRGHPHPAQVQPAAGLSRQPDAHPDPLLGHHARSQAHGCGVFLDGLMAP